MKNNLLLIRQIIVPTTCTSITTKLKFSLPDLFVEMTHFSYICSINFTSVHRCRKTYFSGAGTAREFSFTEAQNYEYE